MHDEAGGNGDVGQGAEAPGPYIEVNGLALRTPAGSVYEDVSFALGRGQVCSIFGDNGCGKTSLLLTVCGRMKPSAGGGSVAGFDLTRQYRRIRRISAISFISGINDVQPFMTVHDLMAAELSLAGFSGTKAATDTFLDEWDFVGQRDVRFRDLRPYDKALFGVMLACAGRPQLLVVDDVQTDLTQHESLKLVGVLGRLAREKQVTTLFACTEYEIARHADALVVLGFGAVAQRRAVLRDDATLKPTPVVGVGCGATWADIDGKTASERGLCSGEGGSR